MAKILIVDDSGLSRRSLQKILATEGHQILEAVDGFSALESYFLDKPDLVLLDLMMVGMDGFEVLDKLLEMNPQARIVVATADIQASTREIVTAKGASAYINKPLTRDKILLAINLILQEVVHESDGTPE
jgi:two-component system, chemotaxis family, chemotaxis protein CheY